uniref:Uncharacterized protein n=1 Tax=Cacopsylla melanoneura TaxID=428564 RepID=A0A8D8WW79_9HEMI
MAGGVVLTFIQLMSEIGALLTNIEKQVENRTRRHYTREHEHERTGTKKAELPRVAARASAAPLVGGATPFQVRRSGPTGAEATVRRFLASRRRPIEFVVG